MLKKKILTSALNPEIKNIGFNAEEFQELVQLILENEKKENILTDKIYQLREENKKLKEENEKLKSKRLYVIA